MNFKYIVWFVKALSYFVVLRKLLYFVRKISIFSRNIACLDLVTFHKGIHQNVVD